MMNSIVYKNQSLQPAKIVCIGRNYRAHIDELKNKVPDAPVVFIKPNSAISNQLSTDEQEEIHYESELSFLIKNKKLHGVAFGLDLTKRQTQTKLKSQGLPWERAKAFDKSAVFSKFIECPSDINGLRLELEINGQIIQKGGVAQMINSPLELLEEVASFMSFENGDILMTGTPSGVGIVHKGDVFIGRLYNDEKLLISESWQV